MSRINQLAYGFMVLGLALAYVIGGRAGFLWAVIFFLAGSALSFLARSRRGPGTVSGSPYSPAPETDKEPAQIRVEIKEAHAYAAKPASESNDPKLDFDVFTNVALVSETLDEPSIKSCQLKIGLADGTTMRGERIKGDLGNWRIEGEQEDWDLWDTSVTEEPGRIAELNTDTPLQCLVPRTGWLHFRVRNITPSEFQQGSLEVAVEDLHSGTHVGRVSPLGSLSYPVSNRRVVPLGVSPSEPGSAGNAPAS